MDIQDVKAIAKMVAEEINAASIFNKWLTFNEACQYAKVSQNTMRRWINDGLIYATRTTGGWRIDRESIDDYFNMERL